MSEPVVVGLLGITHPHASARVRALREIDGVEVVAAADDDSRLKYFTDKYGLEPRSIDDVLADDRINAIMVHSSLLMVPHDRVLQAASRWSWRSRAAPRSPTWSDCVRPKTRHPAGWCRWATPGAAESVTRARLIDAGAIGEAVTVSARGAALVGEHPTQHLM